MSTIYQTYSGSFSSNIFELILPDSISTTAAWPEPPKEYRNILPLTTKDLSNLSTSYSPEPQLENPSEKSWPDLTTLSSYAVSVVATFNQQPSQHFMTPRLQQQLTTDSDLLAKELDPLQECPPHTIIEVWTDSSSALGLEIV